MSLVDACVLDPSILEGAHDHLDMFVPCECRGWGNDAPVQVVEVVVYGAASGTTTYQLHVLVIFALLLLLARARNRSIMAAWILCLLEEEGKVAFDPGVLVAADDHTVVVGVEEEDRGVWWGGVEEVLLEGEV